MESQTDKFFDYLEKQYGITVQKQPGPPPRPGVDWLSLRLKKPRTVRTQKRIKPKKIKRTSSY